MIGLKGQFIQARLLCSVLFLLLCLPSRSSSETELGHAVIINAEKIVPIEVILADTPETWEQGLKGVEYLPPDRGMLFIFPREVIQTFSLKGISFPIDLILINRDNRIISIFDTVSGDKVLAFPLAIVAALEIKAGFCQANGVRIGDLIKSDQISVRAHNQLRDEHKQRELVEQKLIDNLESHPDDAQVYEELAVFYLVSRDCAKAIELFEQVLGIAETAPRLNGMGAALAMCQRDEEAEQFFVRAMNMDPHFQGPYSNLGLLYLRQNRRAQAEELFCRLQADYPETIVAYQGLVRLALSDGNIDKAELILDQAREQNIPSPELQRLRGDVALRAGRLEQAADYYLDYLRTRPNDEHAAELRSFILNQKIRKKQVE
ncbi:DUF192 domain-containing protein [bacterium]|nr:DUF192 domain-containing protein [bacterium]